MPEISCVSAQLAASQEESSSMNEIILVNDRKSNV
jgi:hypothetical protein